MLNLKISLAMKKGLVFILAICFSTLSIAQTGLSYGISLGVSGNGADYLSGDSDANALFYNNDFGKGNINFTARYFFNEHWSLQSGLGFSSIGFNFALAKDYSLLKKEDHFTQNNLSISILQVPVTAIYAFTPTCKNSRWFICAGFATMSNYENTNKESTTSSEEVDATNNPYSLEQTVTSEQFTVLTGQFIGGIEKVFNKGGILQLAAVANWGFSNIAYSTVSYTINNKDYSHTFSNKGNYFGFAVTYYFKPIALGNK